MAMVNPALLNLATAAQVKDSRWLTLEVCREFQRNKCTRTDTECKFAHPPPHVEVQNGRVTACFDSIKGKCQRKEPPCKYLHPPQHLREQLLQNGRNNLILKNLQLQAAQQAAMNHAGMLPAGIIPINNNIAYSSPVSSLQRPRPEMFEAGINKTAVALPSTVLQTGQYPPMLGHPYLSNAGNSTTAVYNPYISTGMPTIAVAGAQTNGESPSLMSQPHGGVIPSAMPNSAAQTATKLTRPDRLESQNPVMMAPYKRIAMADPKGLPTMYQPISNIAYQQTLASMQTLQQPQFIPVSLPMVASPEYAAAPPMVTGLSGPPQLPGSYVPNNAHSVNYFDDNKQLLDTLPVCKDFKLCLCQRPTCKYIHLLEDYVEVTDGRVTVCRDAVRGKCSRPTCKYYHIPIPLPPSE